MRPASRLLALVLLVTACGGDGVVVSTTAGATLPQDDTTTTTVADDGDFVSSVSGLSGLDAELAALRHDNDGRLPADAALDLFSVVFGPVPGADPTRFEFRPHDGTMAMMGVLGHWDSLQGDQQQAVRALLGYSGVQSIRSRVLVPDPALQEEVDDARGAIAARIGSDVPFPIVADRRELGHTEEGERIAGMAIAEIGGELAITGGLDRCVVAFPPEEVPSPTTVAHEVFHCFQYHLAGDVALVYGREAWIVEGSAEWAGAEIAGVDSGAQDHFAGWVENLGSMFALDYTAIGFYWVVESLGVDPAPLAGAMLRSGGKMSAITALGLDPGEVLNRIAISLARRGTSPAIPEIASSWDFSDPQVPPGGVRVPAVVTEGETIDYEAGVGGYAWGGPVLFTLDGGTRVQVIADSDVGTAQFYDKELMPWSGSMQREFCLEPGGCRCGVDGAVDPGLGEGSRRLIVAAGEAGDGPFSFRVRIPHADGEFTDGRWSGQVTTSFLLLSGDGIVGVRSSESFPAEFVIENGAVTSGAYTVAFSAEMHVGDAHGFGTATISGIFTGCGFSPQMQGTSFRFEGVAIIDGTPVPLEFDFPMSPAPGVTTTFWVPDRVSDPNVRTGSIDASGYLAAIASSGLAAAGMEISFQLSRSG